VAIDIDQARAIVAAFDEVRVPDLLIESLRASGHGGGLLAPRSIASNKQSFYRCKIKQNYCAHVDRRHSLGET
jgi:hypothetical protein